MINLRRASKNLHETVKNLVLEYKHDTVLDLGSGFGGLPKMLKRENIDVTATDLNPEYNRVEGIKVFKWDLNESIFHLLNKKFDVVTCTEVIEHLYNTKKLFKDAYDLLAEDGVFIFSTPNNQNWFSRLYFLFTGAFPFFHGQTHESSFEPHITPIFTWQVNLLIKDLFVVEEVTFNRSVLPVLNCNIPFKGLFWGQNLIMVLRKISSNNYFAECNGCGKTVYNRRVCKRCKSA